MDVKLTRFKTALSEGLLKQGEDFQESDYELDGEKAIRLLESLAASRSRLFIKGKYCNLEFEVVPERPVTVEIYDIRDGFWAISEVSPVSAKSIIMMADAGEEFGNLIPETTEEWGAYGPSGASRG